MTSLITIFLHEKEIVVPAGVKNPDAARLTVAAAACLLLVGFDDFYCFDRIQTVVLTDRPFRQRLQNAMLGGLSDDVVASGVYTQGAPVALSWRDVRRDCADPSAGDNVVIHEFAHHIDDLDGALAGDPPFHSAELVARWRKVVDQEMRRLEAHVDHGRPTVLDPYGLSSPVEFFAVACEAFFCNPHATYARHPEMSKLLQTLFHLDPRPWYRERDE